MYSVHLNIMKKFSPLDSVYLVTLHVQMFDAATSNAILTFAIFLRVVANLRHDDRSPFLSIKSIYKMRNI